MRFTKKLLSSTLVLSLALILMPFTALANDAVSVTINGQPVVFTDQNPEIVDGRTLVPVAGVFQALGFDVLWNGETRQATLSRIGDVVIITLDSATFTTNGISHTLDVPAQSIGGRTMVPIATVLRSVGYEVDWDDDTRTVVITTPIPVPEPVPEITPEPLQEPPIVEEAEEITGALDIPPYPFAHVIFNGTVLPLNLSPDFVLDAATFIVMYLHMAEGFDFGRNNPMYFNFDDENRILHMAPRRQIDNMIEAVETTGEHMEAEELTEEEIASIPIATILRDARNINEYTEALRELGSDAWYLDPHFDFIVSYEIILHIANLADGLEATWDASTGTLIVASIIEGLETPVVMMELVNSLSEEYGFDREAQWLPDEGRGEMTLTNESLEATFTWSPADGFGIITSGDIEIEVQIYISGGTTFIDENGFTNALREIGFVE